MASKNLFLHLRTHSSYSFLRGLPEPVALAQAAARDGMPALALTDHHSLTGAIEFYDACQSQSLHPILGLEVEVAAPPDLGTTPAGGLILLAMNRAGWTSLCRISSMLPGDESSVI
jgi:DNA polymerase-3 subunit alpha